MKIRRWLHYSIILLSIISLLLSSQRTYARSDDWCIGDPLILIDGTYLLHTTVAIPLSQLPNMLQNGPVTIKVIVPNGVDAHLVEDISLFPLDVSIEHRGERGLDLLVQTQTLVPTGSAPDPFPIIVRYLNVNSINIGADSGTSGTALDSSVLLYSKTTHWIYLPLSVRSYSAGW